MAWFKRSALAADIALAMTAKPKRAWMCRVCGVHDGFVLSYAPARRSVCLRCGEITEASVSLRNLVIVEDLKGA